MPADVPFHLRDGEAFLKETDATFDAIVLHAFVGDQIPNHFCSQAFFEIAHGRLAPNGVVLFNVHVAHDFDPGADVVGQAMTVAGFSVRILDAPCVLNRNAIVVGGAFAGLKKPHLMMPPEFSAGQIPEELGRMSYRPCRCLPAERE